MARDPSGPAEAAHERAVHQRYAADAFAERLAREGLGPLRRGPVRTLQVNVTRRCNLACHHCHVESGPKRSEDLDRKGAERMLALLARNTQVEVLDLTGGAPELSVHFRYLVQGARALGRRVIDRCNLTVLFDGVELRRSARVIGPRAHAARALIAIAWVALVGGACSPSVDSAGGTLVVTGSSTIAPIVAELAKQYEHEHPGVRIDVQSGGSSRGIGDVRSGLADIGMVSRALVGEERKLHAYPIARDGVALVLNARNPVSALSEAQVAAIYRGEIERWSEVGGRDARIVVVHKAEGRATLAVFLAHFGLDNREIEADVIAGENEQAIKTVARSPDAIGYVSIGTAAIDIEHGVPIRLLEVGGVPATLESVRRGAYPITRPLILVTREPAAGLARDFIDSVRSPPAAAIFDAQSFVQVGG